MCRGAHAGGLVNILVGDGDAEQRRPPTGHHRAFRGARGGQGLALGHQQEGVQFRIPCLDPGKQILDQLHRRKPLRGDQSAGLGDSEE